MPLLLFERHGGIVGRIAGIGHELAVPKREQAPGELAPEHDRHVAGGVRTAGDAALDLPGRDLVGDVDRGVATLMVALAAVSVPIGLMALTIWSFITRIAP